MLLIHPLKGVKQEKTDEKRIAINYHIAELLKEYIETRGDTVRITRNSVSDAAGDVKNLAKQLKPTVTIIIDCAVDINENVSGYSIQCDHYTALVKTWNYELTQLGLSPVTNTGYTVTNKLQYGSTQDIKLLLGYATNNDDLTWLSNENNQEKLVKRLVQSAYAPPKYAVKDSDPAYVEDPYFYTYDSWTETEPISGCSGEILETEYSNTPVRYLHLTSTASDLTEYTWTTTMTHVGNAECYFIATVNPHGGCIAVIKIGSQSFYETLQGKIFKQVIVSVGVTPTLPLCIGIKGSGTIDFTGIWVASQGSLGSLADPRVQYSMFPPGYRSTKIVSYDQPSGISVCLTAAKSLLERAQDDLSSETSTGLAKDVNATSTTEETANVGEEGSVTQSITTTDTNGTSAGETTSSSSSSSSSSGSNILTNVIKTAASVAAVTSFLKLAGGMLSDMEGDKSSNGSSDPATKTGEKDNEGNTDASAEDTANNLNSKAKDSTKISDKQLARDAEKMSKNLQKGAELTKETNKKTQENAGKTLDASDPNPEETKKKAEEANAKRQAVQDKLNKAASNLKDAVKIRKEKIAAAKKAAANKVSKASDLEKAKAKTEAAKTKYENMLKPSETGVKPTEAEIAAAKKEYEEAQASQTKAQSDYDDSVKADETAKEEQSTAESGVKDAREEASNAIKEGNALNPTNPKGAAANAIKPANKEKQKLTPNDPTTKAQEDHTKKEKEATANQADIDSAQKAVQELMDWVAYTDLSADACWNYENRALIVLLSKYSDAALQCWHTGMEAKDVKNSDEQTAWHKANQGLCLYRTIANIQNDEFLSPEQMVLKKIDQSQLFTATELRIKTKPSSATEQDEYDKYSDAEKKDLANGSTSLQTLADAYWVPDSSKIDVKSVDTTKIPLNRINYKWIMVNAYTFRVPAAYDFPDEVKFLKISALHKQVNDNLILVAKAKSNTVMKPYDYTATLSPTLQYESGDEVELSNNAEYSSVGYIYSGEKYKILYKYDAKNMRYVPCTDSEVVSFLQDSTINGVKYTSLNATSDNDNAAVQEEKMTGGSIFPDIKLVEYVDLKKKLPLDIVKQILSTKVVPEDYKVSKDEQKARIEAAACKERITRNAAGLVDNNSGQSNNTGTKSDKTTTTTNTSTTSVSSALSSVQTKKKNFLQKIKAAVDTALANVIKEVNNFLKKS